MTAVPAAPALGGDAMSRAPPDAMIDTRKSRLSTAASSAAITAS
jgi:hypothetical protein